MTRVVGAGSGARAMTTRGVQPLKPLHAEQPQEALLSQRRAFRLQCKKHAQGTTDLCAEHGNWCKSHVDRVQHAERHRTSEPRASAKGTETTTSPIPNLPRIRRGPRRSAPPRAALVPARCSSLFSDGGGAATAAAPPPPRRSIPLARQRHREHACSATEGMALNAGLKLSDVKQVTVLFRAMTKGDEPLWNYH
jgi:hypothetical protein